MSKLIAAQIESFKVIIVDGEDFIGIDNGGGIIPHD